MKSLDEQVGILARELRETLDKTNGKNQVGFALFLFNFGPDGRIAYASNAQREDFIKTLEEFLVNIKAAT